MVPEGQLENSQLEDSQLKNPLKLRTTCENTV